MSRLGTRLLYQGTFDNMPDSGLIRVNVTSSSLIKIKGSAFSASLESLDANRSSEDRSESASASYSECINPDGTSVTFGTGNYLQTLGGGNYAVRFASGTGEIIVTETSGL